MRIRGMAVVLAMLLAFAATLAVFLYVRGVRNQAKTGGGTVDVIVSKQDIVVGQQFNPLITEGAFVLKQFPRDSLVQGAVTDLNQLRGQTAGFPILAGEQISTQRFQSSNALSAVGLEKGFQAVTIPLDAAAGGGGAIQPGDHVTIYGDATISVGLVTVKDIIAGRANNAKQDLGDITMVIVPDVKVLKVNGAGPFQFTLELKPDDAEKVVLAANQTKIWLGLVAPGDKGQQQDPINIINLLNPKAPTAV